MATPQTYTSTGDVTIPTSIPRDEGGTLMMGSTSTPIGYNEFNYQVSKNTDAQMYEELQNFIALFCRATTTGLSTGSAASPYASVTPREVLMRLQVMIQSMLQQSSGS